MTPRLRRLLWVAGTLVLAVLLAMAASVYLVLQPSRFTAMLQQQAHAAGLELSLNRAANPSLFPCPALELHGIKLNAKGAEDPILLASSGRLVLSWGALFGKPIAITQMEMNEPRVDLAALQNWLAVRPALPAETTLSVPRIDTGIRITHGSVMRAGLLLLDNVTLTLGGLIPDHQLPLAMSATTAAGAPLQFRLTTTPHIQGNALQHCPVYAAW